MRWFVYRCTGCTAMGLIDEAQHAREKDIVRACAAVLQYPNGLILKCKGKFRPIGSIEVMQLPMEG